MLSKKKKKIETMPSHRRYAFGSPAEVSHPNSVRAIFSEFFSTFIFVFAGEGCVLALDKIYGQQTMGASKLIVVALAHALSLAAAVACSMNVSGGHVNPAVTFGTLVGGRISGLLALYYWIAQLLGAIFASLLLRLCTDGMRPGGVAVAEGVGVWNAVLIEILLTFGLVYTVYATAVDPNRGSLSTVAPLAIGLIGGANIFVGGPYSGASMNPASAFGPALVGWRWKYHWVYWLGPMAGGGLAGLIYEFGIIQPTVSATEAPNHHHPTHNQPLAPPQDY